MNTDYFDEPAGDDAHHWKDDPEVQRWCAHAEHQAFLKCLIQRAPLLGLTWLGLLGDEVFQVKEGLSLRRQRDLAKERLATWGPEVMATLVEAIRQGFQNEHATLFLPIRSKVRYSNTSNVFTSPHYWESLGLSPRDALTADGQDLSPMLLSLAPLSNSDIYVSFSSTVMDDLEREQRKRLERAPVQQLLRWWMDRLNQPDHAPLARMAAELTGIVPLGASPKVSIWVFEHVMRLLTPSTRVQEGRELNTPCEAVLRDMAHAWMERTAFVTTSLELVQAICDQKTGFSSELLFQKHDRERVMWMQKHVIERFLKEGNLNGISWITLVPDRASYLLDVTMPSLMLCWQNKSEGVTPREKRIWERFIQHPEVKTWCQAHPEWRDSIASVPHASLKKDLTRLLGEPLSSRALTSVPPASLTDTSASATNVSPSPVKPKKP